MRSRTPMIAMLFLASLSAAVQAADGSRIAEDIRSGDLMRVSNAARALADALAGVGTEDAKSGRALGKLLGDGSADVALAAAEALGGLPALAARELSAVGPGAKRAIPTLEKMAERDDDEAVREAAKAALELIRP